MSDNLFLLSSRYAHSYLFWIFSYCVLYCVSVSIWTGFFYCLSFSLNRTPSCNLLTMVKCGGYCLCTNELGLKSASVSDLQGMCRRKWGWGEKHLPLAYGARIFKLLRGPRIDSKASIPPTYVAWRAGTTTLFLPSPHRSFKNSSSGGLTPSYLPTDYRSFQYFAVLL